MTVTFASSRHRWMALLLKIHLRRHRRSGELTPAQQQAVDMLLADPTQIDELASDTADYGVADGEAEMVDSLDATSPTPQKPIGRFLQWLWDNRQQILQFVLMIVGLFTGKTIPLPTAPSANISDVPRAKKEESYATEPEEVANSGPQSLDDLNHDLGVIIGELQTCRNAVLRKLLAATA